VHGTAGRRGRRQRHGDQSDMPAARLGDQTAHGGSIVLGCFTVIIGG